MWDMLVWREPLENNVWALCAEIHSSCCSLVSQHIALLALDLVQAGTAWSPDVQIGHQLQHVMRKHIELNMQLLDVRALIIRRIQLGSTVLAVINCASDQIQVTHMVARHA